MELSADIMHVQVQKKMKHKQSEPIFPVVSAQPTSKRVEAMMRRTMVHQEKQRVFSQHSLEQDETHCKKQYFCLSNNSRYTESKFFDSQQHFMSNTTRLTTLDTEKHTKLNTELSQQKQDQKMQQGYLRWKQNQQKPTKKDTWNVNWLFLKNNRETLSFQQDKHKERKEINKGIDENISKVIDRSLDKFITEKEYKTEENEQEYLKQVQLYVEQSPSSAQVQKEQLKMQKFKSDSVVFRPSFLKPDIPQCFLRNTSDNSQLSPANITQVKKFPFNNSILGQIFRDQQQQQLLSNTNNESSTQNNDPQQSSQMQKSYSQSFHLKTLDGLKEETKRQNDYQKSKKSNPFNSSVKNILIKKLTREAYFQAECKKLLQQQVNFKRVDRLINKDDTKVVTDKLFQDNVVSRVKKIALEEYLKMEKTLKSKEKEEANQANNEITLFSQEDVDDDIEEEIQKIVRNASSIKNRSVFSGAHTERTSPGLRRNNEFFNTFIKQHEKNQDKAMRQIDKSGNSQIFQRQLKEFVGEKQEGQNEDIHFLKKIPSIRSGANHTSLIDFQKKLAFISNNHQSST